jgi:hypothetical protein
LTLYSIYCRMGRDISSLGKALTLATSFRDPLAEPTDEYETF